MIYTNILKPLFFILPLAIYSCKTKETIEAKNFPIKNIPEHNFNIGINKLRDTITSLFNLENQDENKFLRDIFYYYSEGELSKENKHLIYFNVETAHDTLFSKDYFLNANTSNDIYIHDFGTPWLSKLYFSNGKQLEYKTAFIIKLSKINNDSTKLSIIAEGPKVLNGISGYGPHGAIARETIVNPTSIEEYSLLLFISEKLGDTTLIPLKLPNNN